MAGSRAAPRLSLDEVHQCGLPALFLGYGEVLLYLGEQLFSMRDEAGPFDEHALAPPLPAQILESGLGIEYGWRHLAHCACRFCAQQASLDESQRRAA